VQRPVFRQVRNGNSQRPPIKAPGTDCGLSTALHGTLGYRSLPVKSEHCQYRREVA
jgi:hypothetical protein